MQNDIDLYVPIHWLKIMKNLILEYIIQFLQEEVMQRIKFAI
jgi:hypothetical protein